jgi:hypothetical protein
MYQPVYQPQPRKPLSDYVKPLVSDFVLAIAAFVGLLFVWIGSLIWGFADDLDGRNIGLAFKSFGMLAVTCALIIGGMLRHDLDKWVRFAMIAAGTLLIILVGYWSSGMWLGDMSLIDLGQY